MASASVVQELVVPVLGVVVNVVMILAPIKTFIHAETLGELSPIPFVFTLINSTAWFSFALVARNPFVFAANDVGILAGLFFTARCYALAHSQLRRQILALLVISGAVFTTVAGVGALGRLDQDTAKSLWGITGNVCSIIYYLIPLSAMFQVVKNRNSASLHVLQNLANGLNAALWTTYGLSTGELLIALPNIPGCACSALALVLIMVFPRKSSTGIASIEAVSEGYTEPPTEPAQPQHEACTPMGKPSCSAIKIMASSSSRSLPSSPFAAAAAAVAAVGAAVVATGPLQALPSAGPSLSHMLEASDSAASTTELLLHPAGSDEAV